MLREARKKETKERIIHHTIELFKQKGYEQVTVEEITLVCGIAKGTFFNYFEKKEHVLLHIADSYMGRMDEIVQRHQERPVKERVLHIFRDILRIYLQHFDLLRLALVETIRSATESKEEQSTNMTIFQEKLRKVIEEGKESGSFRSRWDSNICASIVAGIFFNTLMNWSSNSNEEKMMRTLQQQLDVVWGGIADE